ncbi:MAG TPA: SDR family NAD(P)-dependent oxidoreductase [Blastocatellia bacterium]|jgi:acyl transferase domain-containing protein/acyl carrier protein|nr:SDR family NAD(P)-dependent oxidoreductase [Blastocatellia bacterium]
MENSEKINGSNDSDIAVIGLTCRFPGAGNHDEFWRNLRDGVESISFLSDQEVEPSIVDTITPGDPAHVKAASVLEGADLFDAQFFGFTPREAEIMDPQQRLFLECAWEALEHSGYDPETYRGAIGVFAGARTNTYLFNLFSNRERVGALNAFEIGLGNDLAFLSTRVSYKLNLRGPSYSIHTACSTSLVAVHLACQSLLIDECQMALAGGVAVNVPQKAGYVYQHGGIVSPDGHCRAFDANAQGTIFGSGAGIVVLKRLEDALADGDSIYAVIKGSAANNDGSDKASFTAPSVHGQSEVIAEAMASAGVRPETITYVETHGTGTALGDPIEIRGLAKAFRGQGKALNHCGLGSVKTNFGHLDAAAGIASFIKAVLAIKHKQLPPSLHYSAPNPNIDFDDGSFYVNTELSEWKTAGGPRRAGVSSFGVGGTNAHVILEEAPPVEDSGASRPWQLLVLSARSDAALDKASANLTEHLRRHPEINLSDVAYTLQVGRRPFARRRILAARDVEDAVAALERSDPGRVFDGAQEIHDRPVAFMFPGGGAQYPGMGGDLYHAEPVFRQQVDECSKLLEKRLNYDLREALFPSNDRPAEMSERFNDTSMALPSLFVVEYALARLLMSWGVRPEVMIGHSLGEYVAACLAGVFSLEDALSIVVLRGRLFERLPPGAMLSVSLSESETLSLMGDALSLAAVNGSSQCVMSGPVEAIDAMAETLAGEDVEFRRLHINVAAHSKMVEPLVEEFAGFVQGLTLMPPEIPFISNVTGSWITDEEATDPYYWAGHLRKTVRFADGLENVMKEQARILLEVGPGQTLTTLVKLQRDGLHGARAFSTMRHPYEQRHDESFLLAALGKLWISGAKIDWRRLHSDERRRRVPLPTYPFERQRYWVGAGVPDDQANSRRSASNKKADVDDWFYIPSWRRTVPPAPPKETGEQESGRPWLVFVDESNLGRETLKALDRRGQSVVAVYAGEEYRKIAPRVYTIRPLDPQDYVALCAQLQDAGELPSQIVHLWSLTAPEHTESGADFFESAQRNGYYSLLFLAQAVAEKAAPGLHLWVVSNGVQEVESTDICFPEKATMLGPCKVIPQEYESITTHCIDVAMPAAGSWQEGRLVEQLLTEIRARALDAAVAYRGSLRMVQDFEPVRLGGKGEESRPLREQGVYLITGGLGGVGLLLARYLARAARSKLVLLGRSPLPDRGAWDEWSATHDKADPTSVKIAEVRAIEAAGGEVMVIAADVADEQQMRSVVARIDERFGGLNGLIHAAGITSGASVFNPLMEIGRDETEAQFRPKVYGTYVLEKVLYGRDLDFCLMTSSNSSVLGGMGLVAYSAANAFMDAFASGSSKTGRLPWISSSWDPWPEETKRYTGVQTSMDRYVMTEQESTEAFRRIVTTAGGGHVVVATGDLTARLDLWIRRDHTSAADSPAAHPRPQIQGAYAAPRNEMERDIAELWQEILGVERVGIKDNFFDLGGHSLLATRLVARLRDLFNVSLPLQKFFEAPSVAGLAQAISDLKTELDDVERSRILELLAGLSDEEVDTDLKKRK